MFKFQLWRCWLAFLLAPIMLLAGEPVIRHPDPGQPLSQRWEWAAREAGSKSDFWIGYCIRRMMEKDSHIGSFRYPPRDEDVSLQELLSGKEAQPDRPALSEEEELRQSARQALAEIRNQDASREKISKEVAILFRVNPAVSAGSGIREIKISNLSLAVNLKSLPLFWLGEAENGQSITLLQGIFEQEDDAEVKEELITAISIHDDPAPVFSFLKGIVNSKEDESIRESAIFWMGQQNSKEVLEFLLYTAENDRSGQVREEAVFAISQMQTPEATAALIGLARSSPDKEIQNEAVFWLGQMASKQAETALTDFAYSHDNVEIQKSAVFALSQLSGDAGVPRLIEIAKSHTHPKIRKEAIFWLSQSEDPRALDTLVEILEQQ